MKDKDKIANTAKVSPKGQVALPVDIRKKLNINSGDRLIFEVNEDYNITVSKMSTQQEWAELLRDIPVEEIQVDGEGKVNQEKNPEFADWLDGDDYDY